MDEAQLQIPVWLQASFTAGVIPAVLTIIGARLRHMGESPEIDHWFDVGPGLSLTTVAGTAGSLAWGLSLLWWSMLGMVLLVIAFLAALVCGDLSSKGHTRAAFGIGLVVVFGGVVFQYLVLS